MFYFQYYITDELKKATTSVIAHYFCLLLIYEFLNMSLLYLIIDTKAISTTYFSTLVQAVIPPQHDASAEKDPPAGLSSIHSLTLDSV